MVQKLKDKVKTGLAILGASAVLSGCVTTGDALRLYTMGNAKNSKQSRAGYYLADKADEYESKQKMQEDERNKRILAYREYLKQKAEKNATPQGLFVYNYWKDKNGNNAGNRDEYIGLDKRVFDLDNETIWASFYKRDYDGDVIFSTWKGNKLIGETKIYNQYRTIVHKMTGPNAKVDNPPDFMDLLREDVWENGAGNYTIVVNTDEGDRYSKNLRILGSKKEPSLQGFFIYSDWKDKNGDGRRQKDELQGLNKKAFDLASEKIEVVFKKSNYNGDIIFRTIDDKGHIIGESKFPYVSNQIINRLTGPNQGVSEPPDFMDLLREDVYKKGSGKYKITAEMRDGATYSLEIKVVK